MNKQKTGRKTAKRLYGLIFALLIVLLFILTPSLSKYVFNSTTYNISISSANTFDITAVGNITGIPQVTEILTAGDPMPVGAQVTYQWVSCSTMTGTYTNISGATSKTYTLTGNDVNQFIKVVETGMAGAGFTGSITSGLVGPVASCPLISIGLITGNPKVNSQLTAGAVLPSGATFSYQWQRCIDQNGTYQPISGANSSTYTPTVGDYGYYIRVIAVGTGGYSGTLTSASTETVGQDMITGIGLTTGTVQVDKTLTAGAISPSGASSYVSYQWYWSDSSGGSYQQISGATSSSYTISPNYYNKYIKVIASGSGAYGGSATSASVGPVAAGTFTIGTISGTPSLNQPLSISVSPSAASSYVSYQWKNCSTSGGTYNNVASGGTLNPYTVTSSDAGKFIEVTVSGSGAYSGTFTSGFVGPVAGLISGIGPISGTVQVDHQITAGAVSPSSATVTYQWWWSTSSTGTYQQISGATAANYMLTPGDYGHYIKVVASGTGIYSGYSATSDPVGSVAAGTFTVNAITGTTAVGNQLSVTVSPSSAASYVTFQWKNSSASNGTYNNVLGSTGTSNPYTLIGSDYTKFIKVFVKGNGGAYGSAEVQSGYVGAVTAGTFSINTTLSGSAVIGQPLSVTVSPSDAASYVNYQWKSCATPDGTYVNVASGGTVNPYTVAIGDAGDFLEAVVTGNGGAYGNASYTSDYKGPVTGAITGIGNITYPDLKVGSTLTAGAVSPAGASSYVTYQWYSSPTVSDSDFTPISGATSSTYTLTGAEYQDYMRVVATGTGPFEGSMATSAYVGKVVAGTFTINSITGSATVGQPLTITTTPADAASYVTYQWKNGYYYYSTYYNVAGPTGTSNPYTLVGSDYTDYIKVVVTGNGGAYGSASLTSDYVGPVAAGTFSVAINGVSVVGQTLSITFTPSDAASYVSSYRWKYGYSSTGTFYNISATSSTYKISSTYAGRYLRIYVTPNGGAYGSTTEYNDVGIGPVTTALTGISISGTKTVGKTLTASVSPSGAASTADYQWYRVDSGGTATEIFGATSSTYILTYDDLDFYIKVTATGNGSYSGSVSSQTTTKIGTTAVTGVSISGTKRVGYTLTANVTPAGSDVDYVWMSATNSGGPYNPIAGAENQSTYTLTSNEYYDYIKVIVTGKNGYAGTITSSAFGRITY